MKIGYFLIATGIILSIVSVIFVIKIILNVRPILKMKFSERYKDFYIEKRGNYSIWKEYIFLTVSPLEKYNPIIINMTTGENVPLQKNAFRIRVKSFNKAKTQVYSFFAEEGQYRISLSEIGKEVNFADPNFKEMMSKYGLQISKGFDMPRFVFAVFGASMGTILFVFGILFSLGVF